MTVQTPQTTGVTVLTIEDEFAGQRVDNFLLTHLKGVPKSHVYRILRTGQVRLNGGRIDAGQRLSAGDRLRVPPVRVGQTPAEAGQPSLTSMQQAKHLESRVLLEDSELIVIDKPSGMAVHGGSGLVFGVIEAFRQLRPDCRFLELVHRIDRETSGCLVLAKKRSALRALHEQFRGKDVDKRYTALLSGPWRQTSQLVDAPLEKNILQGGERVVRISPAGKQSSTEFKRLKLFRDATLVEARPLTGRTHQIRVHASSLGHALAGDERYGSADRNKWFRQAGLRRLFLHAGQLSFLHPGNARRVSIEAPLDAELTAFLDRLAA